MSKMVAAQAKINAKVESKRALHFSGQTHRDHNATTGNGSGNESVSNLSPIAWTSVSKIEAASSVLSTPDTANRSKDNLPQVATNSAANISASRPRPDRFTALYKDGVERARRREEAEMQAQESSMVDPETGARVSGSVLMLAVILMVLCVPLNLQVEHSLLLWWAASRPSTAER